MHFCTFTFCITNQEKIDTYFHSNRLIEKRTDKKNIVNHIEMRSNFPGVILFIVAKSDAMCRVNILFSIL